MESLDSNANDFKGCLFMNKNEFAMKYSPHLNTKTSSRTQFINYKNCCILIVVTRSAVVCSCINHLLLSVFFFS